MSPYGGTGSHLAKRDGWGETLPCQRRREVRGGTWKEGTAVASKNCEKYNLKKGFLGQQSETHHG